MGPERDSRGSRPGNRKPSPHLGQGARFFIPLKEDIMRSRISEFYSTKLGWCYAYAENNKPMVNHWSSVIDDLKKRLWSRENPTAIGDGVSRLTDHEVCILSFSLGFGPTPGIPEVTAQAIMSELWPKGNAEGASQHPDGVNKFISGLGFTETEWSGIIK
jgi:hypothetical protein